MNPKGTFEYDFVALGEQEMLVGLKINVPTHDALVSLINQDKRVSERLVKLARAGLPEDFEKAAMHALFEDRERNIPLVEVDYSRLARLLVLAWRDEPLESVPVQAWSPPPSLKASAEDRSRRRWLFPWDALRGLRDETSESALTPEEEREARSKLSADTEEATKENLEGSRE